MAMPVRDLIPPAYMTIINEGKTVRNLTSDKLLLTSNIIKLKQKLLDVEFDLIPPRRR
jgi:hypothetical protein